jgi:hypothetical protein
MRGEDAASQVVTHDERYEQLLDILTPTDWWDEHRKRTYAQLPCGCEWELVECADAGGSWMEERWTDCTQHNGRRP